MKVHLFEFGTFIKDKLRFIKMLKKLLNIFSDDSKMGLHKQFLMMVVLGLFITAKCTCDGDLEWLSWKLQYNKYYESEYVEQTHREIWERNKAYIETHNLADDVTFKMELNQFADQVLDNSFIIIIVFTHMHTVHKLLFDSYIFYFQQRNATFKGFENCFLT